MPFLTSLLIQRPSRKKTKCATTRLVRHPERQHPIPSWSVPATGRFTTAGDLTPLEQIVGQHFRRTALRSTKWPPVPQGIGGDPGVRWMCGARSYRRYLDFGVINEAPFDFACQPIRCARVPMSDLRIFFFNSVSACPARKLYESPDSGLRATRGIVHDVCDV